jgi:aromatic-L-amino-acid decarboxylase
VSSVETEPAAERSGLRLDVGREEALAGAAAVIAEAWRSFDRFRVGQPPVDPHLARLLREPLPARGSPTAAAIADAARALDESIAQPRPRYFAFIGSSGLEIGVIADLLAACYDVNLAVWAGAASEVELQAVRWAGEFVGFAAEAGSFTSGGTVSNLTALTAARERALPGARHLGVGDRRLALYCSAEVHYSVVRAAELLGIGSSWVRALPIDRERRLRPEAVAEAIDADRRVGVVPVAVVATAGTTLTGAVDPIDALADCCAAHGVWLHVDGAYGLPAARVPAAAALFRGLERADSVTIDAHKWLYLPKACGVVLVRRRADLHAALGHEGAYLPHDREEGHAADITLEYSRPFRALKLWLALRVHGADAFRAAIERNLEQARLLHAAVLERPDLEPLPTAPQLSIVPFRHAPPGVDDLDGHNAAIVRRLQEGGEFWVAHARIDGRVYIRPCIVNFRTDDADVLAFVEHVDRLGRALLP